jgi:hypothetical protein
MTLSYAKFSFLIISISGLLFCFIFLSYTKLITLILIYVQIYMYIEDRIVFSVTFIPNFLSFFFFLEILGLELRASCY